MTLSSILLISKHTQGLSILITKIHQTEVYHLLTQILSHFSTAAALSGAPQRIYNTVGSIWEAVDTEQFCPSAPLFVSYMLK